MARTRHLPLSSTRALPDLEPQAEKGCGSKCPVWSGRSVVLQGAGALALGCLCHQVRAHEGSEQLPWGAAPAAMVQCRLQSQFC